MSLTGVTICFSKRQYNLSHAQKTVAALNFRGIFHGAFINFKAFLLK